VLGTIVMLADNPGRQHASCAALTRTQERWRLSLALAAGQNPGGKGRQLAAVCDMQHMGEMAVSRVGIRHPSASRKQVLRNDVLDHREGFASMLKLRRGVLAVALNGAAALGLATSASA
jgi:hypothetical protein